MRAITWIIGLIILVIVGGVAWWLISPAFRVVEAEEPSPLEIAPPPVPPPPPPAVVPPPPPPPVQPPTLPEPPEFKDAMDDMTDEEMGEFKQAVAESLEGMTMDDEMMPAEMAPSVIAQGDFMPRAHEVEGRALLISTDDKKILRFENFETINGPNLHIYLASELGVGDAIDLGEIKATRGNVNYELDPGIDTTKYNKVLVWCVPFRVLFSYAELG